MSQEPSSERAEGKVVTGWLALGSKELVRAVGAYFAPGKELIASWCVLFSLCIETISVRVYLSEK